MLRPPRSLSAKLSALRNQLLDLPKTLQLVWEAAPRWTSVWLGLLIVQGVLPAITVYLTKVLVDGLTAAIRSPLSPAQLRQLALPAIAMAAVLMLGELLQSLLNYSRTVQSERVQDHIARLIQDKAIAVDYAFYESSAYYDQLERARSDASSRSLSLLENSGSLLQNSITFLAMAAVLIPYGAWLPPALLVSTLPAFYVVLCTNRQYHRWWHHTTADRRRVQYHDTMISHSSVAAELRLFELGDYFQSAYVGLRRRLVQERLHLIRTQSVARLLAGTCGLLVSAAAIGWMGWQAVQGRVTLGDLALFQQAFSRGQTLMRTLLGNVGQVYANSLFLGSLFEFLQLQPQLALPSQPQPLPRSIQQGIVFEQVTFRYPGSSRAILDSFNLTIPAGKITAIVGDNGAGKSTLLKLLCRLYDPEAGRVTLDGIDIRQFSVRQFQRLIAVLFQFPVNYHDSAALSIAFGDLARSPSQAEIEQAAHAAGAHEIIARLPQGYDTILGKWFEEGTNLSGGELQRVSLARAFLRQSPILVLDEPTSAMDPWAEFDWLERFRGLAADRTAIVITHRFTLAMRADIIHVMQAGRIVESGTHDQLLAQGGFYARSWQEQMQARPLPENASV